MRNYENYKYIEEKEVLNSIECDKCHRKYYVDKSNEKYWEIQEFVHIHKSCGYGSIIGDGDIVEIDLCQKCFKLIVEICIDKIENFVKKGE